jgi:hypothetical protein
VILIGPFKKTTNCDRHVASKPNKRSEINIQICAKFMIEGNIKYMLDSNNNMFITWDVSIVSSN